MRGNASETFEPKTRGSLRAIYRSDTPRVWCRSLRQGNTNAVVARKQCPGGLDSHLWKSLTLVIGLLVGAPAFSSFGADLSGMVVGIADGDTITILRNGRAERMRLNGIDCPEKGQAFGTRAKQVTSALAFGKTVTL